MNGQERPTALYRRVDLSAGGQRASGAPAPLHALRVMPFDRTTETRPCVCGGPVTANPDAPAYGVQAHNFTGRHKAWRANREDS